MINLTLAALRKEKKITQAELAAYLGVSFQTVSKWENGISMPDISQLPALSKYFNVSTDEILGLKPLKHAYIHRESGSGDYWNQKIAYLKSSRHDLWNDDYLEFLVKKVWKITQPVKIADFGCGYGYLGMKLLPLLPPGSSYTGFDISINLLEEAKLIFKEKDYETDFVHCDLYAYEPKQPFDVVICQAFLRHLPEPKAMLQRMVEVVKENGLVIGIEVNRVIETAGLYIHDYPYEPSKKSAILQKHWNRELESEGRDFAIGQRLPCYMREMGLSDVQTRLNDHVTFIDAVNNHDMYEEAIHALKETLVWDKTLSEARKKEMAKLFMSRGMNKTEIDTYIQIEENTAEFVRKNNVSVVRTLGLLMTCGRK